ncbi:hypothetical protein Ahy_B05g074164 [Arachis hypogaea]|uniref:Transposase MuDR plant domain-containing protein n=1 Tax=Arachis hypogaea TaxID=3818 RepID=A0A444YY25_ARAHY|nr:hypothetical protein Ahy_B05g074164 [Arachis hypogaea]
MSFLELQNGLCDNIQSHISKMVPIIELYVEFEQHTGMDAVGDNVNVDELGDIDWEEDNNDNEEDFEANYEVDDGDLASNPAVQNEAHAIVSQHPFGVPSFIRTLDLEAMHVPEYPKYANIDEGNVAAKDGEFSVGMEFGSRESMISAIKSYTISRGVDYTVYEYELQTFYEKCKGYDYSRTEQEYNKNYERLKEWGETYTQWCDEIGVQRWVLVFDGGHHWGHMTTNLVECNDHDQSRMPGLVEAVAARAVV